MTQEAFKAWWYNEGSQAPYTHHDCEEHTMRMCEIAWANGAYKALAEHAMQEVQRLGQEIEQMPAPGYCKHCKQYTIEEPLPPQPEQTPIGTVKELFTQAAWERLDLKGSTEVYITQPQRIWVGLTDEDMYVVSEEESCSFIAGAKWSEAILKEKNT